jgi:hypothetical protein
MVGCLYKPYLSNIVACDEAIGGSGFFLFFNAPDHSGAAEAFFLPTRKPFDHKLGL